MPQGQKRLWGIFMGLRSLDKNQGDYHSGINESFINDNASDRTL